LFAYRVVCPAHRGRTNNARRNKTAHGGKSNQKRVKYRGRKEGRKEVRKEGRKEEV